MLIKSFQVKNYKSIIDSGVCYLTDSITILAGKNESGKTSILEALEDFDTNKTIRDSAKPIMSPDKLPEISITFILDKDVLEYINKELGLKLKTSTEVEFVLTKSYPKVFSHDPKALRSLQAHDKSDVEKIKTTILENWSKIKSIFKRYNMLAGMISDLQTIDVSNELIEFTKFKSAAIAQTPFIKETSDSARFTALLDEVQSELETLKSIYETENAIVEIILDSWVPNFILFSSFDDVFPNKVPFTDLEKNSWVQDLAKISDLDPEVIKSSTDREKFKHKTDINVKLNKDYEKFWTQDVSKLSVEWDSQSLFFWIEEDGYPYEPSLRSKGRQWHLAFYIRVTARATESVQNVILIDEPGLFLHAKAQVDILEKLEASGKDAQVVFSTHSPYLLETDKLNRIRLVHRTKKAGTRVENKVHKLADKETLTPILTAIGLEMSSSISDIGKELNVIVEGPCDYYYLNGLKVLANRKFNFVYGGGAGNMPMVGTILHGWGCKVVYLYDNDQGKRDGERNLRDHWLVRKDLVTTVLEKDGRIEDIFSIRDFRKLVLLDESLDYTDSNSEYIKKAKVDKVLRAKRFLENVQLGEFRELDVETQENIAKLFTRLDKAFR